MKFNKLINSILRESYKEQFVILYRDGVYKIGDAIENSTLDGRNYLLSQAGFLKQPDTWIINDISHNNLFQPKIIYRPEKTVVLDFKTGGREPVSVIGGNTINVDNIDIVTTYWLKLDTDKNFKADYKISYNLAHQFLIFQSKNKDGTHTTWYNPGGDGIGDSLVLDFQIIDKNEHEKNLTVQAHKDSDLSDMVDF
jgi:hypothetical protein